MLTTVVAVLALVAAVTALVLVALVVRQSADVTATLRRHRLAHADAHGHPDPKLDRRQVQIGPPRTTGERRGAHRYEPPAERLAPRPRSDYGLDGTAAGEPERAPDELAPGGRLNLGAHGVDNPTPVTLAHHTEPPDTAELEQHDMPTTMLETQRPDVPRNPGRRSP
jgi:hypothetical protein